MNKHKRAGSELPGAGRCETVLRMCSDFHSQMRASCGSSSAPLLNLALAYEDAMAGSRALRIFQNLFENGGNKMEFNLRNVWRFDFLHLSHLRDAAIAETVRADLIIVSVRDGNELPPSVKSWLEASLAQRDGDPGALVLLSGASTQAESPHLAPEKYLAECARLAGLDFFVKRSAPERGSDNRDELASSKHASRIGGKSRRSPNGGIWQSRGVAAISRH